MNAYVVEYLISRHKMVRLMVAADYAGLAKELAEKAMHTAGYAGGVLAVETAPAGAMGQLPLHEIDGARLYDIRGEMGEKLDC